MSDFPFTEEHLMLRDMVREFVNAEIKPRAHDIDEKECIPQDLIRKIADLGLLGAVFPQEYGGGGFGEVGYCLMQEEIGRGCLSTATFVGAHESIGSNAIYLGGSEELKRKYLVPLAEGKYIGAFALTEVLAGSDSFNLRTRAKRDGDEWVINGEKMWITNGGIADVVSLFARTDKGITGFVVETKTPGYHAGPPEKKMGIRGSTTNAITLDNVRVPASNMIGEDGRGFLVAMKTLDAGRLGLGAACGPVVLRSAGSGGFPPRSRSTSWRGSGPGLAGCGWKGRRTSTPPSSASSSAPARDSASTTTRTSACGKQSSAYVRREKDVSLQSGSCIIFLK